MIKHYRDIQLIHQGEGRYLAVACDVSAYIGPMKNDKVKIDGRKAGYYAAAVPLMELMAIGAKPISVINTLGVAMNPLGIQVIEGIKAAMTESGIPPACLTGSTEDNIPADSTSIGVTVVAQLGEALLARYKPKAGQWLMAVGIPKVGATFLQEEIVEGRGEVMDLATAKAIRRVKGIGHMLPVGSKGIAGEVAVLLALEGLRLEEERTPLDMLGSAGPSSCLLVSCDSEGRQWLEANIPQPLHNLGRLV